MTTPLKKGDRLYLIDGSAYIFRAYHALPPLTRKSDGMPVGAVSGFCNMLWKLLADVNDDAVQEMGTPTILRSSLTTLLTPSGMISMKTIKPTATRHRKICGRSSV